MDSLALTLGRILFGGHLIFNTVNHFTNLSKLTGYAQPKGVPAVHLAVAGGGILLLIGGISVVNIFPVIGVIA